jgi:hypothetical protein
MGLDFATFCGIIQYMNEPTINYAPIWIEKRWTGDGFGDSSARIIKQLKREGDVAIYSRTVEKNGRFDGYEVVKIGRHNGYELGGNQIAPAETYPGSSAFGKTGFSFSSLTGAEAKFQEMVEKQTVRDDEDAEAELTGSVVQRRGRPRKDKSNEPLMIPAGLFTHEDFAILNNTTKPACYLQLRALVDAGTIVLDSTKSGGRGKPTNLFRKA